MIRLSPRAWILNAAAVFSGRHGAVTRQAKLTGCSRATVYEHAREVEERLDDESTAEVIAELRAENRRLGEVIAGMEREAEARVLRDPVKQRQRVVTAFAMGVSLRQIEDLLGVLLLAEKVPDHSTLGRWVQAAAQQAGHVLKILDPACASRGSRSHPEEAENKAFRRPVLLKTATLGIGGYPKPLVF